ncbi:MAG: patatin-like phospholipase family protein [Chloroflexi bacterium]|nr:patatin-like phospholipase family protein [Chloroflexota bacterium]
MKQNLFGKPKLGLALSGGGARGLAHIGVLKELERAHIQVDYLAGTSMGGLVAAVYASGMHPDAIEEVALRYTNIRQLIKLVDPMVPRYGLFQGELMHGFFREVLQNLTFTDLRIPLTLVAVDLISGQEVHLNEGNVADAVRATVSLPGIFAPVGREGQRLVDGGLLNNLPADVVRQMGADIVLAVDVSSNDYNPFWQSLEQKRFIIGTLGGLISVLGESLDLIMRQQRDYKLQQSPPDFMLKLPIPSDITVMTGYNRGSELIAVGEAAAHPIMADLQKVLIPDS